MKKKRNPSFYTTTNAGDVANDILGSESSQSFHIAQGLTPDNTMLFIAKQEQQVQTQLNQHQQLNQYSTSPEGYNLEVLEGNTTSSGNGMESKANIGYPMNALHENSVNTRSTYSSFDYYTWNLANQIFACDYNDSNCIHAISHNPNFNSSNHNDGTNHKCYSNEVVDISAQASCDSGFHDFYVDTCNNMANPNPNSNMMQDTRTTSSMSSSDTARIRFRSSSHNTIEAPRQQCDGADSEFIRWLTSGRLFSTSSSSHSILTGTALSQADEE